MANKLIIGPVYIDNAAGGTLRALVTGAAMVLLRHDVVSLANVDLQEVMRGKGNSYLPRWEVLCEAAIATDPLWRQTFASLSVGPTEFSRFELERIRLAMMWPRLFKALVESLVKEYNCDGAEIHVNGDPALVEPQLSSIICGFTIRLNGGLPR